MRIWGKVKGNESEGKFREWIVQIVVREHIYGRMVLPVYVQKQAIW